MMKNYMLKYLAAVFLIFISGRLSAQDNDPLARLYETFSQKMVTLKVSYSVEKDGLKMTGNGDIRVQNDSYHMDASGYEIYCDGQSVWVVDEDTKEVVIEPVAEGVQGYMTNPALLLARLDDTFEVKSVAGMTYTLSPKVSGVIKAAKVTLDQDGRISRGEFTVSDGSLLTVAVNEMSVSQPEGVEAFRPETAFDKSWIVTDLR